MVKYIDVNRDSDINRPSDCTLIVGYKYASI